MEGIFQCFIQVIIGWIQKYLIKNRKLTIWRKIKINQLKWIYSIRIFEIKRKYI